MGTASRRGFLALLFGLPVVSLAGKVAEALHRLRAEPPGSIPMNVGPAPGPPYYSLYGPGAPPPQLTEGQMRMARDYGWTVWQTDDPDYSAHWKAHSELCSICRSGRVHG